MSKRNEDFLRNIEINLMVEHFECRSVELGKISRVNIADAPDNGIMRNGSAD